MPSISYQVIIGNTETVCNSPDFAKAEKEFARQVELSKIGFGRADFKPVILVRACDGSRDDEPIDTYYPDHFFERRL